MENSGDKFHSHLIPNCHRTASQEAKLQSCPFARESKPSSDDILIQSSSSPDEPPEQPTGIEMVSLPDSFDEYQTPPEQPCSQNSSNDGHVAASKPAPFDENRVVDLANESDNLDTEPIDVDEQVDAVEAVDNTEVISSPELSAHQVFDKMPQREQELGKRKLPVLMRKRKESSKYLKHGVFKDVLNRVLKMVEITGGGGGGGEDDCDFVETAKKRGLSLPRPRWWPTEGFED
ncbi:hypothetical protein Hanom_Chr05g00474671 [Helianthus anomalus]